MAYTSFKKNDIDDMLSKEWLVTNGIGGYSSSSICGANTRKYHGLLVAALNPPTNRYVLVSKIEEAILIEGEPDVSLSTNEYTGSIFPEGFRLLESFKRNPLPVFLYKTGRYAVEKTVFMPYESNTTVVEYKNTGEQPIRIRLNPIFVHRDYHSLFHENSYFDYYYEYTEKALKIYPHHGSFPLYFRFTKGSFKNEPFWFKNFQYHHESRRGLGSQEDGRHIGSVTCDLAVNESVYLVFTLEEPMLLQSPDKLKSEEIQRINRLVPENIHNEFYKDLIISVDQFLVHRKSTNCYSIIAGYHWFTDWGRDTMISLLGATVALGKKKETVSIMSTFLKYLDQGMVPNRFPDRENEEPEYNTVDATLWLFVALYEYDQKFQDSEFLKQVYPALGEIITNHIQGTRYNIKVGSNGLLCAGNSSTQLTWMDAKVGDYVVTPRNGCPVEINALWYNALKIYLYVSERIKQPQDVDVTGYLNDFNKSFEAAFWNESGYLNDVYYENGNNDTAIRPNQLYALSLPFPLLDKEKQLQVAETVREHLLTRLGMRTLSPEHPSFKAFYGGNPWDRDTAYHQGTVWPFLIGEYLLAYLASHNYSPDSKSYCKSIVEGFKDHFYNDSGIHCISEIFDGLEPKEGKGCIQQAWSVANLLRVLDKADLLRR